VANCFVVRVNPDGNPAFPSDTFLFNTPVQFRVRDGTPRDSVRFDVTVAAAVAREVPSANLDRRVYLPEVMARRGQ
jgi:hypothetical protein